MGIDHVAILLDSPTKVFFPGQTVTGKLSVCVTGEIATLNGIRAEVKGSSSVWFSKQYGRTTVPFYASECYFEQRIPIQSSENGDSFVMPVGEHQFPFAFVLPQNIPSSYENRNGKVRYSVKAVVDRSWKTNYTCKLPFSVNTFLDLNTISEAEMSTNGTNSKTLGIPPFNSKPIEGKVWIDRIGYVPGESIIVSGHVVNKTGKRMRATKIRLVEITEYYASKEKHVTMRVINEVCTGEFDKSYEWDQVPIMVPPVVPSGLSHCNIMLVGYRIQLIVDPRALSTNLVVPINVIIGNIPLRSQFSSFRGGPSSVSPSLLFTSGEGGQTLDYTNLPPPSYETSMFDDSGTEPKKSKDESEEAEELPFKPLYATYTKI